ncbi:hypothetical protein AB0L44_19335 [Nonomuraea wenchangensis]|uniref:hypothetical protein n=1 Tax=Nonomuraea wenchangensis TaxID=568860 RepID=UPI003435CCD0
MEDRLVPLNALIGLVTPHDVNPASLTTHGFRLVALEVPVMTTSGKVMIDAVLYSNVTNRLIACESKSGANIEREQAERYAALAVNNVVLGARVDMRGRASPSLDVLYVCQEQHVERITLGLGEIDLNVGVLAAGRTKIELHNADYACDALREAFASPLLLKAPPPRYIPFDHESPVPEVVPPVRAALVRSLARRLPQISLTSLAEECAPHYALYAPQPQGQLRKRVEEAARQVCNESPDTFELVPRGNNRDGMVRILDHPEDRDRRGRTMVYKKLARRSGGAGTPHPSPYEQPDLLELLEQADESDRETTEDQEEESS